MEFVKASESDIPRIQEIARLAWPEAYKDILSAEQVDYMLMHMYSTETIANQMAGGTYQYYFLKEIEPQGFIGVETHYESSTTKLHRLYLLPQEKGKGFGKKAMEFVKKLAAESGDSRIILNVNKNNPAQDFYRSQGFTLYRDEIVDIGSGYVMDDFIMEFFLKSPEFKISVFLKD